MSAGSRITATGGSKLPVVAAVALGVIVLQVFVPAMFDLFTSLVIFAAGVYFGKVMFGARD